ncbi:phosphoribosyltransferase [Photobacterium kishitanii]|uniref:phosphoribosyltransferase n=1 Tax=Photobacterium kishitanii TaxID=318456 RepID=UPI0004309EA5|nr:phosphoribosyltransferase family protein [Photobacterium kishitanii]CEO37642.1 Hypoxanthine-guanine phosphoribosyltransferase. In SS9 not in 3TCK [Photobacterium kishitanii]
MTAFISEHIGEQVLSQSQIKDGVTLVAQKLNALFDEAVIISVVPGGMLFTADLVRQLEFDVYLDYISCPHTPGDRQNQSEIMYQQNIEIKGKNVILIDDAIESGGTMKRLVEHLLTNNDTKSLSIATLFVKSSRIDIPVTQFFAYEMNNDDMLVGYGLPWRDKLRNIPYISKLSK